MSATWSELGLKGNLAVRDLWRQKDLGTQNDKLIANLLRHGVLRVKLQRQ